MEKALLAILESVKSGAVGLEDGVSRLRNLAFEDLGFATIDHHRALRRGFPEVVLAQGKTCQQVVEITGRLLQRDGSVLVTRADDEVRERLTIAYPGGARNDCARTMLWRRESELENRDARATILVLSAGTSDLPVAEEARVTAEAFGSRVETLYDVGVAGIHRLLGQGERIQRADVLIVVAGMEGALPSVVAGLTDVPVIGVPTSTGYGTSFGGIAPLLAMLNSCAAGVTVVNIDNGFGAGYAAALMIRTRSTESEARKAR